MALKVTNGLDLASQRIQNLADGSSATDAVTKQQLDAAVRGLDWKQSVRAATTTNGTLASAFANGSTVDGVTLATGDRILIKNQSSGSENGVYTVNASGAPTRATDADGTGEVTAGMAVTVTEGTTQADTVWTLTTNDPITIGTTALAFAQVGGGSGTTYTADSTGGLQLVSTAFSVKLPASSGLVKDGTGLYIDTAIVTRKFSANVGDGSSTTVTVTHNLGTKDVQVVVRDSATDAVVLADIIHATTNTVTIGFAVAPASNAYRATVQG